MKAPRTKRLKLKYDEPLSNFAFNFNLRRYKEWDLRTHKRSATVPMHEAVEGLIALDPAAAAALIGLKAAAAKPRGVYFATSGEKGVVRVWRVGSAKPIAEVWPCRLTISKPVLKLESASGFCA